MLAEFKERRMTSHTFESIGNTVSIATYTTSLTVSLGSFMDYLDNHAAAFGVLIAFATFLVNIAFKFMHRSDYRKKLSKIDFRKRRLSDSEFFE